MHEQGVMPSLSQAAPAASVQEKEAVSAERQEVASWQEGFLAPHLSAQRNYRVRLE
jgi:hypothetical protein